MLLSFCLLGKDGGGSVLLDLLSSGHGSGSLLDDGSGSSLGGLDNSLGGGEDLKMTKKHAIKSQEVRRRVLKSIETTLIIFELTTSASGLTTMGATMATTSDTGAMAATAADMLG